MFNMTYEELLQMKVGEEYYESSQYGNIKFTVKTEPKETFDGKYHQVSWIGKVKNGREIEYLNTKECMHYGASICKTPIYIGVPQEGY